MFLAIDDTDNIESRGTGWLARELGKSLKVLFPLELHGITRHQLLLDPNIPYTSHNSSACLDFSCPLSVFAKVRDFAAEFVQTQSASGSDPGLCFISRAQIGSDIEEFGILAQQKVLDKQHAEVLAARNKIFLVELGGAGIGIIGALASVGLRASGNDGRFIHLKGMRELKGTITVGDIIADSGIVGVIDPEGDSLAGDITIDSGDWIRPSVINDQAILIVMKREDGAWAPKNSSKSAGN